MARETMPPAVVTWMSSAFAMVGPLCPSAIKKLLWRGSRHEVCWCVRNLRKEGAQT